MNLDWIQAKPSWCPLALSLRTMPLKNEEAKQTLIKRHNLGLNQKLILFFWHHALLAQL
jgi:hypothetical protein